MITDKDIRVKSRYDASSCSYQVQADAVFRAVGVVHEYDLVDRTGMTVERMERRLKQDILNKVYGEILHTLKREMYDLKFKLTDLPWDFASIGLTPYVAVQMADEAYQKVISLIDEKMKVD